MQTPNELAKDYSSQSHWQFCQGLDLLHLSGIKQGDFVLDIGCGTGELTIEIAKLVGPTGRVIAVDIDEHRIKIAKENLPNAINNIEYLVANAEMLSHIETNVLDAVFSNYVFHWISDKSQVFIELSRCLKDNGAIALQQLGEQVPFLEKLTMLSGRNGEILLNSFYCLKYKQWQNLLSDSGFQSKVQWIENKYFFDDFNALYNWWEATTHGAFNRADIASYAQEDLNKLYPNNIRFSGFSSQIINKKL